MLLIAALSCGSCRFGLPQNFLLVTIKQFQGCHVSRPRNFTIGNQLPSEGFLANYRWQFSPTKRHPRLFLNAIINIYSHINKYAKYSTLFWRDVAGRPAERHVLTMKHSHTQSGPDKIMVGCWAAEKRSSFTGCSYDITEINYYFGTVICASLP